MTNEFEIISEATQNYILCSGTKGYEDLKLMSTLAKIIMNEDDKSNRFKYKKKYTLKEVDKIVSDFLINLNPYYKDYYDLRKEDGTIIFDDRKEAYNESAYSVYDDINDKRVIYVPIRGTLDDAFAIVHELFHDINLDKNQESITRMFYTEGMSLLGEMLLEDYLVDNQFKDAKVPINYSLYCAKSKAIELDFNINLLLEYLKDNYIDVAGVMNILERYPSSYACDLIDTMVKIVNGEELTMDNEQPYILGTLIATYMYDRIKNNKNNIMELFELNNELKNYTFDQVLDYLDIDYNEWDLNDNSYDILEKCYKKYIKSR